MQKKIENMDEIERSNDTNKNDNIHKEKLKKSNDQISIGKCRVTANITDHHHSTSMVIRQLFRKNCM